MKRWHQNLYCEHCNMETRHRGVRVGQWEIYEVPARVHLPAVPKAQDVQGRLKVS